MCFEWPWSLQSIKEYYIQKDKWKTVFIWNIQQIVSKLCDGFLKESESELYFPVNYAKKYLILLISTVNIRKPPCLEIFSKLMKRRPLWSGFTSIAQVFQTVKCRESKAGPARCSFCHQKHLIWGKRYRELLFQTRFLYEFSPLCLLLCLRTHLFVYLKMSLSSLNCGF